MVDGDLQPVPDGEPGELLVSGSTVMSGYWGEPELNRRALVRRPSAGGFEEIWFRTGDRVRVREDGDLEFVARVDFQVKVRGHRVELGEVEAALLGLEPVEEAVAFTVPDAEGSSAIHAAVVARGGLSRRTILADLKNVLPVYALPAEVTVLESLPRTPTGKVDRKALRARATKREECEVG